MTIIGFNFLKFEAAKIQAAPSGNVNVSNNVTIKEVKAFEIELGQSKQEGLRFIFEFTTNYEPKVGTLLMEGEVLFMESVEKINAIKELWEKDKKVDPNVMPVLLNQILTKCNLQALVITKDLNMLPPIPLPKVQVKKE